MASDFVILDVGVGVVVEADDDGEEDCCGRAAERRLPSTSAPYHTLFRPRPNSLSVVLGGVLGGLEL